MRVLIAEDSAAARVVLQRAVESLGHQTLVTSDGGEAWDIFRENGADVVISDWLMPGMEGPELCRRIRGHTEGPYTYFIFLTSLSERQDFLLGMQAGADDYLTKPLDKDELQVRLTVAGRVTSLHRQLAEKNGLLERLNGALYQSARTDPLTDLGNRLRLREELDILHGRVERYGHGYCAALIDIDRFKRYNDRYGHLAGDTALRRVAEVLSEQCRSGDVPYRYGGEEFLIILPEQSIETASIALDRIRKRVETLEVLHEDNPPYGVLTISVGIAALERGSDVSGEQLLRRADAALYVAKESGRNRIEVSSSSTRAA